MEFKFVCVIFSLKNSEILIFPDGFILCILNIGGLSFLSSILFMFTFLKLLPPDGPQSLS